jgi:hypothetical protein
MYQKPSIKVDGVDLVAEVEMLKRLLLQAQKKEWQGLTDEEIDQVAASFGYGYIDVARAIESKLKEKNYES